MCRDIDAHLLSLEKYLDRDTCKGLCFCSLQCSAQPTQYTCRFDVSYLGISTPKPTTPDHIQVLHSASWLIL